MLQNSPKVAIGIGGWFIGGVLVMQAGKKWNQDIDSAIAFVQKNKRYQKIKKVEEEPTTEVEG